jgi:hypothetical protein
MKKKDFFIIISTLMYSYLFWWQAPGVNFLLFNLLLIGLLAVNEPLLLKERSWQVSAIGCILSSFFVCWWGTTLPVISNFVSVLMLVGFSFKPDASLMVAVINSCFSLAVSFLYAPFRNHYPGQQHQQAAEGLFKKTLLVLVPLIVTFAFVLLYRSANPVFEQLTNKINLDFISFDWLVFTGFGFILMFGVFRFTTLNFLLQADSEASDSLKNISPEEYLLSVTGRWIQPGSEHFMGITLFLLLNVLLFFVNTLDVYCLWIIKRVPEGLSVADYLHAGTDSLILSIVLAVAVILIVFRGYLNFKENNKWLKLLCFVWIAQNAFMLITTAQKNGWIIESSGLTRERIGIYVYLLLCILGLATTFIKVSLRKSNWFLFRKNAWAFYSVLIAACFFNWDNIIVQYNCRHFKSLELSYIDREYQAALSHTCLAALFGYYVQEQQENTSTHKIFTPAVVGKMFNCYNQLLREQKGTGWQSYSRSKQYNRDIVTELIQTGKIKAGPQSPINH